MTRRRGTPIVKTLFQALWLVLLVAASALPLAAQDVPPQVLQAEQQRIEVIHRARQATIAIFGRGGRGGGSGVIITPDGYALSNFHVTAGAGAAMKCGLPDGKVYDAVIVGVDPVGDVSLIKLLGRDDFPTAPLGDSDLVEAGQWCFAVGNPFLLATDFQPTVTFGIISGVHRYQYPAGTLLEYADCIQTDAAINPGNSGGPLFNMQGELIGINGRGSFEKRGRVNVGVGYAISINQIKNFLGYLRSGRIVDHAELGATVGTDPEGRVVVTDILESSDAYRRGLRYGDELISFAGRPVTTTNMYKNILGTLPKGWRVPLSFRREGMQWDVLVRLRGAHREGELQERLTRRSRRRPAPPRRPQPGPGPKQPPSPKPKKPAKPKLPPAVAKYYEQRPGFANYYFNRLEQQRVQKLLDRLGGFSPVAESPWQFEGEQASGLKTRLTLAPDRVELVLPGGTTRLELEGDEPQLGQRLDPPGSGGLLVALYLWRRLLVHGVEKFGGMYYLGTVPLPGHRGLVDCLVGLHGGVETRAYVDPQSGRLLALEMFPDDDVDPCELVFDDYRKVGQRLVPHRLEVRYGDDVYQVFKWQKITLP